MPQSVEISGVGTVEFPDEMSHEDIADRIKNQIIPKYRAPRPADAVPVVAPTKDPNISEPQSNKALDFGKRVLSGIQFGIGETIKGTARAADIAQDVAPVQSFGGLGGVGLPVPAAIQTVNIQIAQDRATRTASRQSRMSRSLPFQIGKVIAEEAPSTFGVDPERDNEFMAKLATAAGEMFPTLAAGVIAGPAAVVAQYGAVAGESQADEALKAGRPDTADVAFLNAAALGGLSEALIGVPGKFWTIVKGARAAGVKPTFFKKWINMNPVKGGIARAGTEGFIRESTQEGIEQVGSNIIASDIAGYEPGRKPGEGVIEAATIGGVLGGTIGGGGAGLYQTHRNLTAQALRETREGPLNLKKVSMLPEIEKATVQPSATINPKAGYQATDFTPRVEVVAPETTEAVKETVESFPIQETKSQPKESADEIIESSQTIPSPAGDVLISPAGVPFNPIRDLIISDQTTMEKSLVIRKMAKDQGVSVKEIQEAVEAEIVVMSHEIASDMGLPRDDAFRELVTIYDKQPLLSSRTSTSIENQAYSTPAPLAYALRNASLTGVKTSVYDATGGTGMLFIGSDLSKSIANELQPGRAEALRKLGISEVTENDATKFVPEMLVGSVHVNPPFGSIPNVNYDGFGIRKLEHLITLKALEAMKDNGTAAIVLGANMNVADTAKGAQWVFENYLYSRYHVAENFEVDGDLYGKQGAKWPVRILIVAGRRAELLTGELAPKRVDRLSSWDEVWERSEKARDEVKRIRESLAVGRPGIPPGAPGGAAPTEEPRVPAEGASEPARPSGGGGKPRGSGGGEPPDQGKPERGPTSVAPIEAAESTGRRPEPPKEPAGARESTGGMEGRPGKSEVPTPPAEPGEGSGAGPKPGSVSKPANLEQKQIEYIPTAEGTPFGTLTPGNIGGGTHKYLAKLKKQVGPLTEFTSKKTGIPIEKLKSSMSSDQIDGVALAIYQIEKGTALIVGHETGIGKGRIAAATLEYSKVNGKIPIFVTKDPKLFSDMFGDISDIGGTIKKPLIFGDPAKASIVDSENKTLVKSPSAKKQKAEIQKIRDEGFDGSGYDSIFLTYSQVNQENNRQKFLEELASNEDVVVVMDEAHEAAGDGKSSMQAAFFQGGVIERGSGAKKTEVVKKGLLNESGTKVGRGGVLYLSATWAKRPDNVPLYFRTDLSKASQSFPQIVKAMKAGGVALQQAISEALAESGQYIRLERDFSDVNYSRYDIEGPETESVVESVDDVTDVLRDIIRFSKFLKERVKASSIKSTAMSESSMAMTEFASKVHNTIGQLLLAAKADAVIDQSVASFKKGNKPVIALMNTMESFLDDFVEDHSIKNGDPIKLTWGDLVKHALSRTLRATRKLPNGDSTTVIIDPESFGLKDEFDRITASAEKLNVPFPVSPIDYILQGLKERGVKMAELTGRTSGIEYANAKKGEGTYKTFKKVNKNTVVNGLNSGVYDGMLLNASGSTGLSLHASTRFKDKRKRDMLIAQPSNDITVFMQTLGRIRRTGMIPGSAEYIHLVSPLQAEIRPAAMTNQKMKSLNANTTAESGGALKIETDDILNKYGDEVVAEYLDANLDMQIETGIDIEHKEDGSIVVPDDAARQFTGRMAVMRDADQKAAYDQILPAYREYIDHLKTTGDYDLDIVVHSNWDAVRQSDTELSAATDESSIFTSGTRVQEWEITDNRHVPTGEEMLAEFQRNTGGIGALEKTWEDFQSDVDTRISKIIEMAENHLKKMNEIPDRDTSKPFSLAQAESELNVARQRQERWRGTRITVDGILRRAGKPVAVSTEETGNTQEGMLVKVKFPNIGKGLRVAPGAFRFNYLVDAPGGKVSVSGAQFAGGKITQTESSRSIKDFTGGKKGARYNRWVVTGNPIAAYQNTGGAGKMVRFATRGGDVVTGLLMPNSWEPGKLASDPRLELINGTAVARLFDKIPDYSTALVELPNGSVRIQRNRGVFGISVTTSDKVIYLDQQLRDITDDFTKTGGRMLVSVYDKETMARAADRIMAITASKFQVPTGTAKDDQRAIDLIAKANKESQTKPPKWGGVTGESGFVLDPMVIAKEIARQIKKVGGYLKRAAEDALDLAKQVKNEQFKIGKPGDYRLAKLRWTGRRQRSWQEAREAQRDIRGVLKDSVTDEAGYAWIEAAGDATTLRYWENRSTDPKRKAAYGRALTLNPAELDMVQAVRDTFAELGAQAQAEGVLNTFRENYVPHLWDIGRKSRRGGGRTMRERMTHAMARTIETSFAGEELGFTPKTKRLSEVVPIYINEMNRVIADRQFARDLRRGRWSDGEPLVQLNGKGIPVDGPAGQATLVVPDVPKNKELKYEVIPGQPALHDWIWAQKDTSGNPIYLKADMALHPEIVGDMNAILGKSAIKAWAQGKKGGATMVPVKYLVRMIDRAQSEYKRTMLGFFATFHQVQEATHGIGHRVGPFNRPKIDLINNPVHMKWVNHGLMLYPDRASENDFREGFRHSGLVSRLKIPGLGKYGDIGKYADMYSDYLFYVFIPEMKLKTAEAILARNRKVFAKELDSGETNEAAILVLSGEQANAAYGHLNYTDLGRSPTIQHLLQLAFLAPDFLEARTRFTVQAAKGVAGAKVGHEQALALGFLAVSQAVLAWLAASLVDGEWDSRHPFEFRKGNRKYTMRSVPEDLMSAVDDWRRFMFNRVNPLTGRGAVMVATGKDWRGENVGTTQIVTELAQGWVPLSVRSLVMDTKSLLEPWEQFTGTAGFKISYYSPVGQVFKLAREWKKNSGDPKLVAEAKRDESETHLPSDYTPMRQALENGDDKAAGAEYEKLLKTKSRIQVREAMEWNKPLSGARKTERAFVESLTDDQKAIYALALQTRKLLFNRFLKMRAGKPMKDSETEEKP